jgi:ankyrin repeat protein
MKNSNLAAFDLLIQHGAIPYLTSDDKSSLWHFFAMCTGNDPAVIGIAKRLSSLKLDLNHRNNNGDTPLHIAMTNNNKVAIGLLLVYRARTDIQNKDGQIPFKLLPK